MRPLATASQCTRLALSIVLTSLLGSWRLPIIVMEEHRYIVLNEHPTVETKCAIGAIHYAMLTITFKEKMTSNVLSIIT